MHRQVTTNSTHLLIGFLVAGLSLFVGATLVLQPSLAWIVVAGLVGIFLLRFPPYFLAVASVIASVFSRLIVSWGIAPGFLNFFHFPLAMMAAFLAVIVRKNVTGILSHRVLMGVVSLGVLTILSWLAGGGEIFKPILDWLLFVEPFLVIYAVVKTAPITKYSMLSKVAFGLALIQVPFALWQAATLGLGDVVQGTLVGHGAGHHIAGAIALMGVLAVVAALLSGETRKGLDVRLLILTVPLFAVSILSDAKQTVVAFIPSLAILLWTCGKIGIRTLVLGGFLGLIITVAGYLYRPLRMATDLDLVLAGLGGKILSYQIISEKMMESPLSFLVGLGPGNSVSRTALAAQEGYIRSLPGGLVDLQLSPITSEILSTTSGFYLFASSSVWSGVSSWLGLFGDLGLIGVGIYAWLLWTVWKALGKRRSAWAYTGKAVLVMGVALGFMFSWLETPEFTLPWALYMAVGLVSQTHENTAHPQSLPSARR